MHAIIERVAKMEDKLETQQTVISNLEEKVAKQQRVIDEQSLMILNLKNPATDYEETSFSSVPDKYCT